MMYFTGACPICGLDIIMDTDSDNPDIIKIRTKRRSTVLVHKECYQNRLNQRGAKSNEH